VTEIRSYRSVFDLERRIYRVDRLRLNPGGIPVRGVVYFAGMLASVALAGALPLLGTAMGVLPWYLRDLLLPTLGSGLLTMIRVEGRPFHLTAGALVRHALGPRHLAGMCPCAAPGRCWRPGELLVFPDGSEGHLRRLRYTGPGAVRVNVAHQCTVRRMAAARRTVEVAGTGEGLTDFAPQIVESPLGRQRSTAGGPASARVIVLARGVRMRVRRAN
jgi:hypothetical protein